MSVDFPFKVDGVTLPKVTEFKIDFTDVSSSNSGRTLSGKMVKELIATKVRISLKFSCVPDNVSSTILNTIKANVFQDVTYPDPKEGGKTTKSFYSGDPSITLLYYNAKDGKCYWDITINLIEE